MARSRTIRPEFWSDEKLARVSRESRLTYAGLWNTSDDYGVTKGNPAWLKSQIYPYDEDLNLDQFMKWLAELETLRRIIPFCVDEEKFYFIPKFKEHQKVDKPSKARNPEPPADILSREPRVILATGSRVFGDETDTDTEAETESKKSPGSPRPSGEIGPPRPSSAPLSRTTLSREEIDISAIPKIEQEIYTLCERLYSDKIFLKAHTFANMMLKREKNHRAVLHTLTRCLLKSQMQKFEDNTKSPWAYCMGIMKVENGNFNERDHQKDSKAAAR